MRYMVVLIISYILGIIWGLYQKLFDIVPTFLLVFVFYVVYVLFRKTTKKEINKKVIIIILISFIIGFLRINVQKDRFYNTFDDGEIMLSGNIKYYLGETNYYNKYIFKDSFNDKFIVYIPKDEHVSENDFINLKGDFKKPTVKRNKGGFDYSKYLYSQNIHGLVYIYNNKDIEILETQDNIISSIRNNMKALFGKLFPKEEMRVTTRNDYRRYIKNERRYKHFI